MAAAQRDWQEQCRALPVVVQSGSEQAVGNQGTSDTSLKFVLPPSSLPS
jgi:hypothetical protein